MAITDDPVERARVELLMVQGDHPIDVFLDAIGRARPAWHAEAACRGHGTAAFFPGRGEPLEPAYEMCNRCPVSATCLADALSDPFRVGVWAGTSYRSRVALRRSGAPPGALAHRRHLPPDAC